MARRGLRVVGRNIRVGGGEIDLLVSDASGLVAVEVKTRVQGDPMSGMDDRKVQAVRTAAGGLEVQPSRFDVVAVSVGDRGVTLRWVRAAF